MRAHLPTFLPYIRLVIGFFLFAYVVIIVLPREARQDAMKEAD